MNCNQAHPPAELLAGWFKSSYSGGQNGCVEVNLAALDGGVGVRDSKLGENSPVLSVSNDGWRSFLRVAADRW